MKNSEKVVLITGAAMGIGLAAAQKFLNEGWNVGLLDNNKKALAETIKAFGKSEKILELPFSVSKQEDVQQAVQLLKARFNRCDALVNNAGIAHFGTFLETSYQQWQEIMDVNVTGAFLLSKEIVPLMRETGGAIVNITSISSLRASTLRVAYGTSKAALGHLTKQMAVELASFGIRVNGVAPGPVDTAMAKKVHSKEIRADYHDAIPLNRYGLPEELADAIYYLCSENASYITGQILAVDGGFDAAGIGLPTLRRQQGHS